VYHLIHQMGNGGCRWSRRRENGEYHSTRQKVNDEYRWNRRRESDERKRCSENGRSCCSWSGSSFLFDLPYLTYPQAAKQAAKNTSVYSK
jgi:hypothetical protein